MNSSRALGDRINGVRSMLTWWICGQVVVGRRLDAVTVEDLVQIVGWPVFAE